MNLLGHRFSQKLNGRICFSILISDAGTGGARGATGPPNIWQISKPYSNRGGQIIPTYYYWHPQSVSPSGITAGVGLVVCQHVQIRVQD